MTIMNLECGKCGWRPATEESKVCIKSLDSNFYCPECKGLLKKRCIDEDWIEDKIDKMLKMRHPKYFHQSKEEKKDETNHKQTS